MTISKLGAGSTLTIESQGGANDTLTGNGNRLFNIEGQGQNVTFKDLTLTGGAVKQTTTVSGSFNLTGGSGGGCILDQGGRERHDQ